MRLSHFKTARGALIVASIVLFTAFSHNLVRASDIQRRILFGLDQIRALSGHALCVPIVYQGPATRIDRANLSLSFLSTLIRSPDSVVSAFGNCSFSFSRIAMSNGFDDSTDVVRIKYSSNTDGGLVSDRDTLLTVCFLITNDRNFGFRTLPVRWIWESCADNIIVSGDTSFLSKDVFEIINSPCYGYCEARVTDRSLQYPSTRGLSDSCESYGETSASLRHIDFHSGALNTDDELGMNPPYSGDIELLFGPGVFNEADLQYMADYMLTDSFPDMRYALGDQAMLDQWTDANCDGKPATAADFIYLRRRIDRENVNPFLLPHDKDTAAISVSRYWVSSDYPVSALALKFVGDKPVVLIAPNAILRLHRKADTTIALLYLAHGVLSDRLLATENRLIEVEASDSLGATVVTVVHH
jgi:hypothetical protein